MYTITNKEELEAFMVEPHHYDKFIVQSLVGNASWSSMTRSGKFFHVGTIPNRKNHTFVSDLRMMVVGNSRGEGFKPVAIYARRARKPLLKNLSDDPSVSSWEMLGTNLSVKMDGGAIPQWTTEAQRLLLMDRKDFNSLGIGIDDLIDAYVQTVLSVIAIDRMCQRLMNETVKETTIERALTPSEMKLEPSELMQPRLQVSAHEEAETRISSVIVDVFERNGERMAREKIVEKERHFNMDLFEALNPDKALVQEIYR